jgi:predicted nucleic acid-binding protein
MGCLIAVRVYLDTNVFVVAVEGTQAESDVVWELFKRASPPNHLLVTSELSLAEALVKPFELMGPKLNLLANPRHLTPGTLAADYSELIDAKPSLLVQEVDRWTLIGAARLRGDDKVIKLPDAIHIATARQSHCTHFVSNDRDLNKRLSQFQLTSVGHTQLPAFCGILN